MYIECAKRIYQGQKTSYCLQNSNNHVVLQKFRIHVCPLVYALNCLIVLRMLSWIPAHFYSIAFLNHPRRIVNGKRLLWWNKTQSIKQPYFWWCLCVVDKSALERKMKWITFRHVVNSLKNKLYTNFIDFFLPLFHIIQSEAANRPDIHKLVKLTSKLNIDATKVSAVKTDALMNVAIPDRTRVDQKKLQKIKEQQEDINKVKP